MLTSLPNWVPPALHASIRSALLSSLRVMPLPQHIGIVLDGNRRFARNTGQPAIAGHIAGREALKRVLEFLLHLPVPHVTLYTFAIDNFNRPQDEIDGLMDLARITLQESCQNGKLFVKYGVRIKVIGRLDLLPEDLQKLIKDAHELTKHNTRGTLNICLSYASTEEMTTAIRTCVESVQKNECSTSDITPELIESNLYTSASPPIDIILRTSGVHRFSDFLLWQANTKSSVYFLDELWPSIGTMELLPIFMDWQRNRLVENFYVWWNSSPNSCQSQSQSQQLHAD